MLYSVHVNPDLKHLHLLLHPALQEHLVSSTQLEEIGGNVVQQVTHVSPDLVHPHSAGLLMSGLVKVVARAKYLKIAQMAMEASFFA